MVVTYQLCKYSEELRELSALHLLPTNDQDPLGASPTMEAQVAGRVMADMFDDGSIFLASFLLLNIFQHSGISRHELRLPGVQKLRMLSNDSNRQNVGCGRETTS